MKRCFTAYPHGISPLSFLSFSPRPFFLSASNEQCTCANLYVQSFFVIVLSQICNTNSMHCCSTLHDGLMYIHAHVHTYTVCVISFHPLHIATAKTTVLQGLRSNTIVRHIVQGQRHIEARKGVRQRQRHTKRKLHKCIRCICTETAYVQKEYITDTTHTLGYMYTSTLALKTIHTAQN